MTSNWPQQALILELDHVQLAMPRGREAEAEWFYCTLLGFEVVTKPPHLAARGGRWFRSGSVNLHLGVEEEFTPARKAHPAFVVTNLDGLRARLEAAGVAVQWDTQIEGFERFYAADPFGNRLEFMQPVP